MCDPVVFTTIGMSKAAAATAAGVATTVGTIASVGGTILSTVGAMRQSQAVKDKANYDAAVQRNNAIIAERKAVAIEKKGELEAAQKRLQTKQLKSHQLVTLAGQGIDVADEDVVNLLAETAELGELDAQAIRSDAAREAYSVRVQKTGFETQAELSGFEARAQSPLIAGASTALSGFGQIASQWYKRGTSEA